MIFTKAYCCTDFLPKLCLGANTIMNSRCVVTPSLYLPIKLATYLSIFGSIELSFHFLNMYLSTCTYLCIYSSIHLFISISIDLFIYLSTDRFVCISTYLFIYFSTCQFVCVYPSAYTSQTSSYLLVIRMCISRCVFYGTSTQQIWTAASILTAIARNSEPQHIEQCESELHVLLYLSVTRVTKCHNCRCTVWQF